MALVEKNSVDHSFNGLVDGCIVKNNIGCLATQFERGFFMCARDRPLNDLSNIG